MDTSASPESMLPPQDDAAARQNRLLAEFPMGIAPYTRGNLLTFGFWGGVVGAGIAGIVNLNRANRADGLPSHLLTVLAFLLIDWAVLVVLIDRTTLPGSALDQNIVPIVAGLTNILLGVLLGARIAYRQRGIIQRWLDLNLAGKPRWRDQGGCLGAIGWLVFAGIISLILYNVVFVPLLPTVFQVVYPPLHFTLDGDGVTTPAGWTAIPPDLMSLNCDSPDAGCLAVVSERWTGSTALILTVTGNSPEFYANAVAFELIRQNPLLPAQQVEAYAPSFLAGRDAMAFSTNVGDRRFVYTAVADGDHLIGLSLTCVNGLEPKCEAVRDQFVASLEFSDS